jgi:hypothetical protein
MRKNVPILFKRNCSRFLTVLPENVSNDACQNLPSTIPYVDILKDWEIAPNKLKILDKKLGAGQFGIVKQGLYTPSENVDLVDVAVKMLKGKGKNIFVVTGYRQ